MPDIIQILPDSVANQIAAGEVVQRPASAVKELLENAIDAEANAITLNIKDAGKTLIQVIDNGKGMSETDARLSLERHATSKISQVNDLFSIRTMGFRGEALASIAAISQFEMKTRTEDAEMGTELMVEGSDFKSQEPCATKNGTIISVKNLFFNVPARRNFLKSNAVETKHIIEEFQRASLTHPELTFHMYNNNQEVLNLNPGSFRQRIVGVFGKKYNERLVPVEEETDIVRISGFVCKPLYAKKTRGEQYFFVNSRFIKSPYLNHAIMLAYEELLPKDLYPSYFLNLEIDPANIDINIHPTKTEIKFTDERAIYAIIRTSVKQALGKYNIAPTLDFEQESAFDLPPLKSIDDIKPPEIKVNEDFNPFKSSSSLVQSPPRQKSMGNQNWEELFEQHETPGPAPDHGREVEREDEPTAGSTQKVVSSSWEEDEDHEQENAGKSIQLHNKFILTHLKSGFMLIDQQRAHERILYEKLVQMASNHSAPSQQLLFPQLIEFTAGDFELIKELKEPIEHLGFSIGEFSGNSITVNGVPMEFDENATQTTLEHMLEQYKMNGSPGGHMIQDQLARSLSRSMSIKAGKVLTDLEMTNLIDELFACEMPYALPNGKPTVVTIQLDELNKRFDY